MNRKQTNSGLVKISILATLLISTPFSPRGAGSDDKGAQLVGNRAGESICVGYRPACHDEQVIFRIANPPEAKGKVTINADKVIDGKPEEMWVLDFTYDPVKQTLVNEFTRGSTHGLWELTVKRDTIEGTLATFPDKTIGRRVKVKKETRTDKPL